MRIFLFISAFVFLSSPYFSQSSIEDRKALYKSVFLFKFTEKVYWQREDNMKEFVICTMTSGLLAEKLSLVSKRAKFRDHIPIKVITCNTVDDIKNCQMLVIDGARNDNYWAIYSKIQGKGVLMVAENLADYKKSMISFVEVDNTIKYITNKTKLDESNLVINKALYDNAIKKEGEWKSILDKFNYILKSGDKNVKADASDVKQMMSMYKNLEEEKKGKEELVNRMTDSLNTILENLESRKKEAEEVQKNIAKQSEQMKVLDRDIALKKQELNEKQKKIGEQNTVISVIAVLSIVAMILLFFAIRSNNQRRRANKLLSEQKNEIEKQKLLVDEKQKEILDSINYAKRIQTALLANSKMMNDNLEEHFVFFKPKDIVAGDFYWATPVPDGFIYITADCTGHGVPGAFMSLLNISKLNDAINQKMTRPDLVLNEVKTGIIRALNPEGSAEESKDGMDAILCKLDRKNMKLQFAAANNSFCIVRNKNIITCKADKMPVGKSHDDSGRFTFNEILLEKGDMIFTFTDGYGDQFGGPEGKKFKHKKLRDIFVQVSEMPINRQKDVISERFDEWKGELEQVDDVLIIGVRV
ncbi:MAG: YfiR/HmsC family protein [bacterium]|nr:YfiR/HmsC family protein [bacterium]